MSAPLVGMAASPLELQQLLKRGAVRWARSVTRLAPATWSLAELTGRVVELVASGSGAACTAAVALVHDAQVAREPVAWIATGDAIFHAPDLAASGIDLEALAVVRALRDRDALRAADELLRSAAFGLVVLDGQSFGAQSMSVQVRLSNLARQHDAVLLCLERGDRPSQRGGSHGSLTSVRASAVRARDEDRGFTCRVSVTKDKRRGAAWTVELPCDAPPGMH